MSTKSLTQTAIHTLCLLALCIFPVHELQSQTWQEYDEDDSYVARHEFSFVQAGDKFVYFGGRESAQTVEVYDFTTDTWSTGGMAPYEFNHCQGVLYEGLIWVIGAFKDNDTEENADYVYMYNPVTETWIEGMPIPEARKRGANGLVMKDDKFYMVGGNTNGHYGGYVSYFDEYDPVNATWTILDDAPNARDHIQTVVYNNKIYALGGRLSGGPGGIFSPMIPESDVYDFTTESWTTLGSSSDIPTPRAGYGVALFNNEIFVIGGEGMHPDGYNTQWNTVEAFDPATNLWETKESLNNSRHGIQAIVSGNGIIVLSGSSGGTSFKSMEYYNEYNPSGSALINSTFEADELVKNFAYPSDAINFSINIELSNNTGDTGTYIDNISLSGDNFALETSYDNRFVKSNTSLNVQVNLLDPNVTESNGTVTITYNNSSQIVVTLNGILDDTLSTIKVENLSELSLYPNPTSSSFQLNKDINSLTIYNLSGKKVKEFNNLSSTSTSFDVSELASGLYFLEAMDTQGAIAKGKLVKN